MRLLTSVLTGSVTALAFSDRGTRLIAGDDRGGFAVWQTASGQLLGSGQLAGAVRAIALDPSGVRFAADTDEMLVVGPVGGNSQKLSEGEGSALLRFHADKLTAAGNGRVATWGLSTGEQLSDDVVSWGQPLTSAFSRDLRLFAGVTLGNDPYVVSTSSLNEGYNFKISQKGLSIDHMAFDPGGSTLAIATRTGVRLWDLTSKRLKPTALRGVPGKTHSLAVDQGGAVVVAVGERGVVVWDLNAEPALVQRIEPHGIRRFDDIPNATRGGTSAVFSPGGNLLAWTAMGSDGADPFVVIWDMARSQERMRLPGEHVISFSPDGQRIGTRAFNKDDGQVEITELATRRPERLVAVPWATPTPSPSLEEQSSDRPWEASNGHGLGASLPADGAVSLWDTAGAQQIAQIPIDIEPDAAALAFDPLGNRLAVAVTGGLVYIVDVNPVSWEAQACRLVARQLTPSEKATYLGSLHSSSACT
jgi:WD40 repeat protein